MEHETSSQVPWWLVPIVGRRPKRTLLRLLILVVSSVVVFKFILLPIRVTGISMAPTYRNGAINVINRLSYVAHPPRRGDVVAIQTTGKTILYLKRIVGLPGETIAFKNGVILVNEEPLSEPYMKTSSDWYRAPVTLAKEEYFVVGDNRTMEIQNHEFGISPRRRILGKVVR